MPEEKLIGKITHYFGKINVGIIELEDDLNVGSMIHIKGSSTDVEQLVDSMQVDHKDIQSAKKGDAVGVRVAQPVRVNDQVFKIIE